MHKFRIPVNGRHLLNNVNALTFPTYMCYLTIRYLLSVPFVILVNKEGFSCPYLFILSWVYFIIRVIGGQPCHIRTHQNETSSRWVLGQFIVQLHAGEQLPTLGILSPTQSPRDQQEPVHQLQRSLDVVSKNIQCGSLIRMLK